MVHWKGIGNEFYCESKETPLRFSLKVKRILPLLLASKSGLPLLQTFCWVARMGQGWGGVTFLQGFSFHTYSTHTTHTHTHRRWPRRLVAVSSVLELGRPRFEARSLTSRVTLVMSPALQATCLTWKGTNGAPFTPLLWRLNKTR